MKEIKGTKIRKQEYKIQAFTDDMVFILEDPLESIERLLLEIKEYGTMAGLKINLYKTKMIVKNMQYHQKEELMEKAGLTIGKKMKYGYGSRLELVHLIKITI